jgi:hypothetical protein
MKKWQFGDEEEHAQSYMLLPVHSASDGRGW